MDSRLSISVLGSTGSIGTQTLEVVQSHPDRLKVVALTAGKNISLLLQQIAEFKPSIVGIAEERRGRVKS